MTDKLGWGIIATGSIAKAFARGVNRSKAGRLVAVASRQKDKAEAFAKEFSAGRAHGSYEALLADDEVQAVYIATPHPMHAEWAIKAAEAKKHLLVEKPIGINAAQASAIIEAAIENDVFLMEAYMYRCHPQIARVVELIRSGAIGEVRTIHAAFSFHWPKPWQPDTRITRNDLAGGGILDVGGYPVSMARLIAGAAMGKDFADPVELKAVGHVGQTGVDEWTSAVLRFKGDIVANVSTGVQVNEENVVRIFGSDGSIFIPDPWIPSREGEGSKIIVTRGGKMEEEAIAVDRPLYAMEADTVAAFLSQRQAKSPAMSWADTMGNARALDAWRGQIGVVYEMEKEAGYPKVTVSGRAMAFNRRAEIPSASIPHLNKRVSRLIMGVDNQETLPEMAVMFDGFFERGGNTFDTAHIYHGGKMERVLGAWLRVRCVREQCVVIVKGAHTPFCNPADLTRQLNESLERIGIECADLYLMHRDNPAIPAGEFVECLNEHVKAGQIKAFGGSNWMLSRVEEANEYAKAKGLQPLSAVSNNFSLARMVEAPWAGCIAASDPESRAWFARTQMPLLSWSSQARGFFLPGRAAPDKLEDKELVRCWYAPDNFERQNRAIELAKKKGVEPINIALAYVLCQPFPTFALIGPRQLSELRSSLPALNVKLSAEEVRWLNLEG